MLLALALACTCRGANELVPDPTDSAEDSGEVDSGDPDDLQTADTWLEADYLDIVALGSTPRDEQDQFGIHIEADSPSSGRLPLHVAAVDGSAVLAVQLLDFDGAIALEAP